MFFVHHHPSQSGQQYKPFIALIEYMKYDKHGIQSLCMWDVTL